MLKFKRFGPHRTERGLSLLEVGMALALAAVVMAGSAWYAASAAQKMKRRTDAQTLMVVARASQAYIVKNSGAWLAAGLVPGTIKDYGVSDLQTDGELSTSISGELSNEQQLRLLIQAVPNPAHVNDPNAAAYVIKGLLVSYTTRNAGRPFTDDEAGQIVSLAGAAGGFVSSKIDSNNVDGANGAWKESVASWNDGTYTPTAGHVAALVNMSYSAADGNSNNGPWLVRKAGLSPQFSQLDPGVHIDMNGNILENASSVQANEYVGKSGVGSDINIGSLTATPNINIGSIGTTSISLQSENNSGPDVAFDMTGAGMTLNSVGSSEFTLPTDGGTASVWSANEQKINTNQNIYGHPWDTVFDSKPGELDLNTPTATTGTSTVMNLNANGDGSSIKLNANGNDSSLELIANGTSNDQITLNAAGTGNNNSINLIASTYAGNRNNTGSINITPGQAGSFKIWDPSDSWGMQFSPAPPDTFDDDTLLIHALTYEFDIPCNYCTSPDHWAPMLRATYNMSDGHDTGRIEVNFGDDGTNRAQANVIAYQYYYYNDSQKYSDRRLKYNIRPLQDALSKIEKLNGYRYRLKNSDSEHLGVIAQEVQKVFPQAVSTMPKLGSDPTRYLGVSYDSLIAPLIEAVKTLHHMLNDAVAQIQQQIAALQQDDATLKTQVQALAAQNAELKTELAEQRLDLIKLKFSLRQPLSADERTLCGASCA